MIIVYLAKNKIQDINDEGAGIRYTFNPVIDSSGNHDQIGVLYGCEVSGGNNLSCNYQNGAFIFRNTDAYLPNGNLSYSATESKVRSMLSEFASRGNLTIVGQSSNDTSEGYIISISISQNGGAWNSQYDNGYYDVENTKIKVVIDND